MVDFAACSSTRRNNHSHEEPWPIMLYDPHLCVLFQHDAPKSSILGGVLASSFQHYLFCYALIHYLEKNGITFSNHVSMALFTPHYFPASVFEKNCIFADKWERQEDRDARRLERSGKKCTFSSH